MNKLNTQALSIRPVSPTVGILQNIQIDRRMQGLFRMQITAGLLDGDSQMRFLIMNKSNQTIWPVFYNSHVII